MVYLENCPVFHKCIHIRSDQKVMPPNFHLSCQRQELAQKLFFDVPESPVSTSEITLQTNGWMLIRNSFVSK